MNLLQTLRVALRAILRNKLRSFLTTLGVIIGVAAVIALVAIGEGVNARIAANFSSLGSDLLIVMPGTTTTGGARGGFGSQPTLTYDDLKAIQTEASAVRLAVPALRSNSSVIADELNWTTTIYGTTPDYFDVRSWKIAYGEPYSQQDSDGGAKVAVLGQTVAGKLYGTVGDALGRTVRIKNIPFLVVGVLEAKGQTAMGQDLDDALYVPLKTFQTKIQGGLQKYLPGNATIYVGTRTAADLGRAEAQIRTLLRDRHRLADGVDDDFFVRNLAELANAMGDSTRTLTLLLAAIASVSLLVGGIGIMNIMLVSVTERTREIGLRMAVGARPRAILTQFVVEALALSVAGGLIGVASGVGLALTLGHVMGWSVVISPVVVLIAVGFSALVGVVFGIYPAHKAARLDPIDALRFE